MAGFRRRMACLDQSASVRCAGTEADSSSRGVAAGFRRQPKLVEQNLIRDERSQHVKGKPDLNGADRSPSRSRRRLPKDLQGQIDQRMSVRLPPGTLSTERYRQQRDHRGVAAFRALHSVVGGVPVRVAALFADFSDQRVEIPYLRRSASRTSDADLRLDPVQIGKGLGWANHDTYSGSAIWPSSGMFIGRSIRSAMIALNTQAGSTFRISKRDDC